METFLKIENIKLWARVGVLDEERELGQLFILDVFLWSDFEKCTVNDDLKKNSWLFKISSNFKRSIKENILFHNRKIFKRNFRNHWSGI